MADLLHGSWQIVSLGIWVLFIVHKRPNIVKGSASCCAFCSMFFVQRYSMA